MMALLHLAHVAWFFPRGDEWTSLPTNVLTWREGITAAHLGMLPLVGVALVALRRPRRASWDPWVGPLAAGVWILHGAVCSSFDQLVVTNITAFMGYCLGMAVAIVMAPGAAAVVYAVAAVAMTAGLVTFQHDPEALRSSLPPVVTVGVVGVVLSGMIYRARRREHDQGVTIRRQREELAVLNARLERRVSEQVQHIVAGLRKVEALNEELQRTNAELGEANTRLRLQVQERSAELSLALAHLGGDRPELLPPGTVLGRRFRIDGLLGAGGMGTVYVGQDLESGAAVAVKVIRPSGARRVEALRRFLREAGVTARVEHPAVVRMLHVDVSDDGVVYQVQEYVPGDTLHTRIAAPWPPAHVARLGQVLAEALAAAHAVGVAHLDVKPGNILLTRSAPGLKLVDFGIAKLYDAVRDPELEAGLPEPTRAGTFIGTPQYMAPELADGRLHVTAAADLYSVGVLLFRLLTGRVPFDGGTPGETMRLHLVEPPPDVRTLAEGLPATLVAWVEACLSKDPEARPGARALADGLRAVADDEGAPPLEGLTERVAETMEFGGEG